MHCSAAILVAALAAHVSAHGLVLSVQGANGVEMPGLTVQDGVPRDCTTPTCGAEADTGIIRDREVASGKASPLGRTQGGGAVDAAKAISVFMGGASAPAVKRNPQRKGGKTLEAGVAKAAGTGATSGMPTTSDSGEISMTFFQINQDGAGPLTAKVDGTSGGTDASAFQEAKVTQNVDGIVAGLSTATLKNFDVKVQMPAGMLCEASVGGADKVCVASVQNSALAGPFGGSVAFTQSAAARKRAIEYRLRKRHIARGILGKNEEE